jgi:hypothetical protein
MTANDSPTLKIAGDDGALFLLPHWTMEHAGMTGSGAGHTDIKNASGSVFSASADPMALLLRMTQGKVARPVGVGFELDAGEPIGWCSMTDNTAGLIAPTGFILKQEAPAESNIASTILALAFADPDFGEQGTLTSIVSAIAPPTTDASFLPTDVAHDPDVLSAMNAGSLRTIVSIFPGPFQIQGKPIPRASQMGSDILFRIHPDNANFIPCLAPASEMTRFVHEFNLVAMSENKPSDLALDIHDVRTKTLGFKLWSLRGKNSIDSDSRSPLVVAAKPAL